MLTWTDSGVIRAARPFGIVPVLVMLRDLFRAEAPERALAVVDAALRSRHLRRSELPALAAMLPARLVSMLAHADGRAESGIETIAALLLRSAGLRVEVQVRIDGTGRVDLLVEGRVVVECDGREWHGAPDAFEEDRRRDLAAVAGRYRVVRASWFRVLF
ncbi:endonuclease domain-containing protein [Amnibacterium kyonggiense]